MELSRVDAIIERNGSRGASLLAILQDVQDEANYLPREALEHVSKRLELPLARVYAMATFFQAFHLEPRGKYVCTVCMGTACHVRGAPMLVDKLERDLGIPAGGTSTDMEYTL